MTDPTPKSSGRTPSRISPKAVVAAVVVVLVAIFIIENHKKVDIRLIAPVVSVPLWLAFLVIFVIGGGVGVVLGRRPRGNRR